MLWTVILEGGRLWGICADSILLSWDSSQEETAVNSVRVCVKNVNVTDTISWQGHYDKVMQLN